MFRYKLCDWICKNVPNGTRTEIQIIAGLTLKPATLQHHLDTLNIWLYIDDQICFHGKLFADPVKPRSALQGLWRW